MISLTVQLPADDADVLATAQSVLKQPPEDGLVRIWAGSDQPDGQLTVTQDGADGKRTIVEPSEMRLITANALPLNGPPDFEFLVEAGKTLTVNYNEVTGGTATLHIKYYSLREVSLGLVR